MLSPLSTTRLLLVQSSIGALNGASASFSDPGPWPQSYATFSSVFKQPAIPEVVTDFKSHFIQHKWDTNVSHIAAGYWYNSEAQGKVRVDEAYDGSFGSSLFDYTNSSSDGGFSNKMWLVEGSVGSAPTCFSEYVADPGFPLVTKDILKQANAVFGGIVNDQWVGEVQSWDLLYGNAIPVIAYLDKGNNFVGFDFWGATRRTKVITRFFNIVSGKISNDVFDNFPCR